MRKRGGCLAGISNIPGAAIEMIVGVLWYCFAYAPLELKDKYLKWLPFSKSQWETILLSTVDFIGINMVMLGVLFKIMWWPFANILMTSGSVIVFIGLISWNFKFKKEVVRRKKAEEKIKEQVNEIQDSIKYAKRIQNAILPPQRIVATYLPNSFILYKPKDIVAGDFYWLESIPETNTVFFAAADCTGHGVPGAMVSVICNNALNRSVREYGLRVPGQILDRTREIVISEFEKSDEEVKDGMDISLCCLNLNTNKLLWAGANNPLWILRADSNETEEIKANKQPIGKYAEPKPFTTHEVQLNKGDTIYIFTDGFQDQFGGENGKKFKAAKLKALLPTLRNHNMDEQREILNKTLENWKGNLEQIDDVCFVGVKI
jgi:serine phosphatase RsbU (regulator of sigma subunit)